MKTTIRKITLICALIFVAQGLFSQFSSVEEGSKWKEVRCNFWASNSSGTYYVNNWRLGVDTTINNIAYKKLYNEQQEFIFGILVGSEEDVLVSSSYFYFGAMREENQRVYMYSEDFYEIDLPLTEKMMFDYSASEGDTVSIWCNFGYQDYVIEEIIPTEMLDGSVRNKFILGGNSGTGMFGLSFIEGIGSNYGVIGAYIGSTNDEMQHLLCYSINGVAVLENIAEYTSNCLQDPVQESCNSLVTNNKSPDNATISLFVYPNPASDELIVTIQNSMHKPFTYRLYSTTGSTVLDSQSSYKDKLRVDVSTVPSGVYLLEVVFNDFERRIEKVIIQE